MCYRQFYLGHFCKAASGSLRKRVTERLVSVPHLAKVIEADQQNTKVTQSTEAALQQDFLAALAALDPLAAQQRGKLYLKNWRPIADLVACGEGGHPRVTGRLPDGLCPTAT